MSTPQNASGTYNDSLFTVLSIQTEFEEGKTACESLGNESLPASIASLEEFDFVISLIDQVQTIPELPDMFWTGLVREGDEFGVEADAYFNLDGSPNVFSTGDTDPWGPGEPNNAVTNQRCTNIDRGNGNGASVHNKLIDQNCADRGNKSIGGIICRQPLFFVDTPKDQQFDAALDDGLFFLFGWLFFSAFVVLFVKLVLDLRKRKAIMRQMRTIEFFLGESF